MFESIVTSLNVTKASLAVANTQRVEKHFSIGIELSGKNYFLLFSVTD